jgi:AcrR family transcriptional regulator
VTFYKYFSNKLELFKHIWSGWSDEIYARLDEMERTGATFTRRMRAIVEFKMELMSRMSPALLEEMIHSGPELEEFIAGLRMKAYERFIALVSGAREKGEMRDVRPEFLMAVLDSLTKLVEDERLRRLYPTDMEFVRELNDFFFFGIIPAHEDVGP